MSVYLSDPTISMHVLDTVLYTLSMELLRRICVTVKSLFGEGSFSLHLMFLFCSVTAKRN